MIVASLPENESERLAVLNSYQILDTPPEPQFDDLTILAAQICQTPIALVSLVDPDRQWFKSKVGVTACETPRDWAFCAHALHEKDLLLVSDALADPRFAKNPLVTSEPHIRFYAGAPLRTREGHALGTLCVIDQVPRELTVEQRSGLMVLARQVVAQFELRKHLKEQEHLILMQQEHMAANAVLRDNLRELASRNSLILSSAGEGIYGLDTEGRTTFVNPAAANMLGYTPDELIGMPMHPIMHHTKPDGSSYPKEECPMYAAFKEGTVQRIEYELLWRKDGTSFPVTYTSTPVKDDRDQIVGAVVTFNDITQRKQDEQARHDWTIALERSNKELDDFAYIASHDLKEPLRGIHNYSSLLLEDYGGALEEEGRAKCETLIRLCQRMEDLINSLFHYSRAGRTELAYGSVPLQGIIEEIFDSLAISLKERSIAIKIANPLPTIKCDRVRVREIFLNLITNAMKYSDKNEKWIEIGWIDHGDEDEKKSQMSGRCPVFFVRDNGIGIREKHLKNIFRIFKRLHGRDKFGGGTGMGLTITKKLIERHGGELWAESVYGEGSTFYFTLQRNVQHVSVGESTYSAR
ncbi:sensor histidine kinase [Candidatus Nitronereus thalassa]|uniref:histidine kinase n=1 Tax=Candidatus Nitronereus thalassa TaxID=3020898 RepID=A0ABU3K9N4_9BACT|nr:ATP-binding protein [Candidatus Nitronereus thalassa]MDT7043130.1 ATP-binding protein [Candidatus Nitronereus thalassa]